MGNACYDGSALGVLGPRGLQKGAQTAESQQEALTRGSRAETVQHEDWHRADRKIKLSFKESQSC